MNSIRFGRIRISRELDGVKFVESTLTKDEEKFVLLEVVRGNPAGEYSRMETQGNMAYLQYFVGTTDQADISISLAKTRDISDALIFLSDVNQYFTDSNLRSAVFYNPTITESLTYLSKFDGLAGLLFTIFTSLKMVILGEEKENRRVISSGLALLPPGIAKFQRFHTYSANMDRDLNWIGLPATQESLNQVSGLEFTHTIVSTTKYRTSTPYSSKLVEELANLIYEGAIEEALDKIAYIYDSALSLPDQVEVEEIADTIASSINDAEFLLKVKEILQLNRVDHPTKWR